LCTSPVAALASSAGVGGGGGRLLLDLPLKHSDAAPKASTYLVYLSLSSLLSFLSIILYLCLFLNGSKLPISMYFCMRAPFSSDMISSWLQVLPMLLGLQHIYHAALISGAHAGITLTHMVPPSRLSCGWHVRIKSYQPPTGSYRVLPGPTGSYRVLPVPTDLLSTGNGD
jgi:hypothetical protein